MAFPQTRHSLIQRLVAAPTKGDWQEFVNDYWGPVCRFAQRRAPLTREDAEDVASETFEILLRKRLLTRWVVNRSAKLRTLLCCVVRNLLANRARVEKGRQRLRREAAKDRARLSESPVVATLDASVEEIDAFYAAWVEELVHNTAWLLLAHYNREGKGDYFRILYEHWCEGLGLPEIARAIGLTQHQARYAYRDARQSLARGLEHAVRAHVRRYCADGELESEFATEWSRLREYVRSRGGLEHAVRSVYANRPC
jgi:RNA polymerase sigma factor (sigma-70 family)